MLGFIARRLGLLVPTFIGITLAAFCFIRFLPGDPVLLMAGERGISEERHAALMKQFGFDRPMWQQYLDYLWSALHGDLGRSFFFKRPVTEVILSKAPATLELVLCASLIVILLSVPLGIYAAIHPRRLFSRFIMGTSIVGVSMPVFLTAIMLIYIFSVELGWLPSFGRGRTVALFGFWDSGLLTRDGLLHLIMPSIALSSIMLPLFIRLIRSEMMEVLESEYVKFAWAKGLKARRVWYLHAFKNTLLPVITVGGVQLGIMVAFTILTETVFQWQGMGSMFIESVSRADTALMVSYIVVVGAIFVVVNTIVDLIYGLVNPTVRVAGRQ